LPFEDFIDLSLELTDSDLDKLDKLAERAEKRLEKARRELERRGGIFAKDEREGDVLPKSFQNVSQAALLQRIQPKDKSAPLSFGGSGAPQDLRRKNKVEELQEEVDVLEELFNNKFGKAQAGKALSFLRNPATAVQTLLTRELPILGGIYSAVQVVTFIIDELTKKGGFFDRFFRDTIEDRIDAFRDKQLQQEIAAGYTQVIIQTAAGSTSPRDAYNTFEQANKSRDDLEDAFSIRGTRGFV
jgi:hypothetical protein